MSGNFYRSFWFLHQLLLLLAYFSWGLAKIWKKNLAQIHGRRKIQFFADIFNGVIGGTQKLGGFDTPPSVFVTDGGGSHLTFEKSVKARFAHSAKRGKVRHVKIFGAMIFDEFHRRIYRPCRLRIFLLFKNSAGFFVDRIKLWKRRQRAVLFWSMNIRYILKKIRHIKLLQRE